MKFDVDLETGTVKAEFTLAEGEEIMAALRAVKDSKPAPRAPQRPTLMQPFELLVASGTVAGQLYQTRIWFDIAGQRHGECQCGDHVYRKRWCKHLVFAEAARLRQQLPVLS